jgi:hypothetical protein
VPKSINNSLKLFDLCKSYNGKELRKRFLKYAKKECFFRKYVSREQFICLSNSTQVLLIINKLSRRSPMGTPFGSRRRIHLCVVYESLTAGGLRRLRIDGPPARLCSGQITMWTAPLLGRRPRIFKLCIGVWKEGWRE